MDQITTGDPSGVARGEPEGHISYCRPDAPAATRPQEITHEALTQMWLPWGDSCCCARASSLDCVSPPLPRICYTFQRAQAHISLLRSLPLSPEQRIPTSSLLFSNPWNNRPSSLSHDCLLSQDPAPQAPALPPIGQRASVSSAGVSAPSPPLSWQRQSSVSPPPLLLALTALTPPMAEA